MISEILAFSGEVGLRQLWKQVEGRIGYAPVDDPGVQIDLDTPEDYRSCREGKL
jgi:CTP:molybdopterin cytidylyltransferase MocA